MSLRIAFVGFRHGHINGLYALANELDDVVVVAACEEDEAVRADLEGSAVEISHDTYADMLASVDCDVVACGDYYGCRGARLIAALEAGRHVIGDKPLCTGISELNRIETLVREKNLRVGCMLDLVDLPPFQALRDIVRRGDIGEVRSINFMGQHPLLYGSRPMWYFEDGKHGGTINDIAIHAVDAIPWITGNAIAEVTVARGWNAQVPDHPHFQDGGVFMLRLDNNCAVLGDVSYFSPNKCGYSMSPYWRMTLAGSKGTVEVGVNKETATLWLGDETEARELPLAPKRTGGYFEDFRADVAGSPNKDGLTTARVLRSARVSLMIQRAADTHLFPRPIPADPTSGGG